ncbi:unnamed protein product [Brassica oleracea]
MASKSAKSMGKATTRRRPINCIPSSQVFQLWCCLECNLSSLFLLKH